MRCPNCRRLILSPAADGSIRLLARSLSLRPSGSTAICPTCRASIPVPVTAMPGVRFTARVGLH